MSKANRNKKVPQVPLGTPVFKYTSVCCDAPAKKPPVRREAADTAEGKFSECGLGKWDCVKCGSRCKVKRSKPKEVSDVGTTGATGTENTIPE